MNISAIKASKLKQALQISDYLLIQNNPGRFTANWTWNGTCNLTTLKELYGEPIKVGDRGNYYYFFICKADQSLIELQIREYGLSLSEKIEIRIRAQVEPSGRKFFVFLYQEIQKTKNLADNKDIPNEHVSD
jgi:hypothetical protein